MEGGRSPEVPTADGWCCILVPEFVAGCTEQDQDPGGGEQTGGERGREAGLRSDEGGTALAGTSGAGAGRQSR